MALIDDLTAQVKDAKLRADLQKEISNLKRSQKFGLVFEEHNPETTRLLAGFPLRPGTRVHVRGDSLSAECEVQAIELSTNTVTIKPRAGGNAFDVSASDLEVVKQFGDPIYPALTSVGKIGAEPNRPHHAVIKGENFHALQLFLYLFEGSVDCIYIDPPYNTGSRDWKYNNRYVDSNDSWRHSKWLSMMEKRLRLAKRLLKPDGVLICTIDEHEINHLGLLLEKIFPEYLLYMITIVINPKGRDKANFAPVDECAFFLVPDIGRDIILPGLKGVEDEANMDDIDEAEETTADTSEDPPPEDDDDKWEYRHARRRGGGAESSSYRERRPNQFYPIYVDESQKKVVIVGPSIPLGTEPDMEKVEGLRPIWPIDSEGRHRCWAFIPESMQSRIDAGNVFLGKYHSDRDDWTINYRVPRKTTCKLKTVWWQKAHDAGSHGTELLKKYIGRPGAFPFPKSIYAVRDCLAAVVSNRPEALILDFFAGSGTTLHATCLLNAEDGGSRRSILVTNNEVAESQIAALHKAGIYRGDHRYEQCGIYEQVTRPRCEAVISGRRRDGSEVPGRHLNSMGRPGRLCREGFSENVEFFRMDYLDPDEVDLGIQFEAILPALWLASGGLGERKIEKNPHFGILMGSRYGILFRESAFRNFRAQLISRPEISRVWLVTDSEEAFAEMCSELPREINVSMLYRDYLRNFRINTGKNL